MELNMNKIKADFFSVNKKHTISRNEKFQEFLNAKFQRSIGSKRSTFLTGCILKYE